MWTLRFNHASERNEFTFSLPYFPTALLSDYKIHVMSRIDGRIKYTNSIWDRLERGNHSQKLKIESVKFKSDLSLFNHLKGSLAVDKSNNHFTVICRYVKQNDQFIVISLTSKTVILNLP